MTSVPPQSPKKKSTDTEIYRDYNSAKSRGASVGDVLLKHGIGRSYLYKVVNRVRNGTARHIQQELDKAKYQVLWEQKYKPRFLGIPKNRLPSSVAELRELIRDMHADGFNQRLIASLVKKDRSTIIHHLSD